MAARVPSLPVPCYFQTTEDKDQNAMLSAFVHWDYSAMQSVQDPVGRPMQDAAPAIRPLAARVLVPLPHQPKM